MTRMHKPAVAGLAAALALFLAACGGGGGAGGTGAVTAPPAPPPSASVPVVSSGTWVVMGSSTAAGAGASAGKSWVSLVQASHAGRAQVASIAVGGSTSYHGLSSATPAVAGRPLPDPAANIDQALARQPVLLFVSYPSNDTALGYSTQETVANLLAIRSQALARGVPVVMLSTQPRALTAAQLERLQAIDQQLAAHAGPCFVEVRTALAAADGRLAPAYDAGDGVHPNDAGHQLIAAHVKAVLDGGKCLRLAN